MHEATIAGSERIGHNTSGDIAIGTSSRIEIMVSGYQHDWPWIRRLRLAAAAGRRYRLAIPNRGSREPHPRLATPTYRSGPPSPGLAGISGAVYQPLLNHLTGRPSYYGVKDYDLAYFDGADLS
jgi:hypothetical protein